MPTAPDFKLSTKALTFARLYAERPNLSPARAAIAAGYSNRGRAAHVRAAELLRDERVIRAMLHYGGLALVRLRGPVLARLKAAAAGDILALAHARAATDLAAVDLDGHVARLERVYGAPPVDDLSDLLAYPPPRRADFLQVDL